MSSSELCEITLYYNLEDFEPDESADEEAGFDASCSITVNWIEPDLFRVVAPCSLTPFGPFGMMLDTGTVVRVELLEGVSYRYVETMRTAPLWSGVLRNVTQEALAEPPVATLLQRFGEAGGVWEWTIGNLTLQVPLASDGEELPDHFKELLDRLRDSIRHQD